MTVAPLEQGELRRAGDGDVLAEVDLDRDRSRRPCSVPSAVLEVTPLTVGAVVSMTMFLALPRLPAAPGAASVSVALFVAASLIVPPFSVSDVVAL